MKLLDVWYPCLRINAPEWADVPGFKEFLEQQGPDKQATWHVPGEIGENSDLFLYCEDGIADFGLPEIIQQQIRKIVDDADFSAGILWVTFMGL